jgi:hypothetical protein
MQSVRGEIRTVCTLEHVDEGTSTALNDDDGPTVGQRTGRKLNGGDCSDESEQQRSRQPGGVAPSGMQGYAGSTESSDRQATSGKRVKGYEYYSHKMLERIVLSHCHFRGKINRMDRHDQGGKDAVSRCGK